MSSLSEFFKAISDRPAYFQFRPLEQITSHLTRRASSPTCPKTQAYMALWSRLVTHRVPVDHLELIVAILSLEDLHEGWANNRLANRILQTPLSAGDIDSLRKAVPRLPSELNVVVSAHPTQNTCAITMLPALPQTLEMIFSPTPEEATAIRLALLQGDLNIGSLISPTVAEMTALRSELSSIPSELGTGFAISAHKFDDLCFKNHAIDWKIDAVSTIQHYSDWFCLRNAFNFAEGLQMFGTAVYALEDGNLKSIYLEFYEHFRLFGRGCRN